MFKLLVLIKNTIIKPLTESSCNIYIWMCMLPTTRYGNLSMLFSFVLDTAKQTNSSFSENMGDYLIILKMYLIL